MREGRAYLDYNATSPLRPQARAAMIEALDVVGNASSVHGEGRAARRLVEIAREQVAQLVGTSVANVVFTSGATEANNWVLRGPWEQIFLARIEHESVLEPLKDVGAAVSFLPVGRHGQVDYGELAQRIMQSPPGGGRSLVTLQIANNETGVVQDVAAVSAFCRAQDVAMHSDGVQAAGRVPLDFDAMGLDFMSLSSHKIGGPMGVGALVLRDGCQLPQLLAGGGQERRRRAGTENVAAIAGFGAAAVQAAAELDRVGELEKSLDHLWRSILEITPNAVLIGEAGAGLCNTLCFAVPGHTAETLIIKLDLAGVAVSSGSACSSGKVGVSHVLAAMGLAEDVARCALRISLGWNTSKADLETFLSSWRGIMSPAERAA